MYNNEMKNRVQEGFWLINDQNEKQPLYFTYESFYRDASVYVADFFEINGEMPATDEYRKWAIDWIGIRTEF